MPLNLRQRFEILKRDHFTCLYCGARPPGVDLVVDHVRSRANGGGNEPSNLITACASCNSGKKADNVDYCAFCVRPLCHGPLNPRDHLEAACGCRCHCCPSCGAIDCPGVTNWGMCPTFIADQEDWKHDVSVEEAFE